MEGPEPHLPKITRRRFLTGAAGALVLGTVLGARRATEATGGRTPRVAFTFDGPFLSLFEDGLPLFEAYGLTGTLYVTSGRVGSPDFPDFCSWSQVDAFYGEGFEISNHTRYHVDLRKVGTDRVIADIEEGKQDLVDRGYPTLGFAYPYHQRNDAVRATVAEYHEYGRAGGPGDTGSLGRIGTEEDLTQLPCMNMAHKAATVLIATTIEECFTKGRDVIWLCHEVRDPSLDRPAQVMSVAPAALRGYLSWIAERQKANELEVVTCLELARRNLLQV